MMPDRHWQETSSASVNELHYQLECLERGDVPDEEVEALRSRIELAQAQLAVLKAKAALRRGENRR